MILCHFEGLLLRKSDWRNGAAKLTCRYSRGRRKRTTQVIEGGNLHDYN
jgi:hypothetical protein